MTENYRSTMNHTTQMTDQWVHQIDELVSWEDSNRSFRLLRVTLQAIRDLLGVDEAAQLAAQLPLFIRGVYFEGWNPPAASVKQRDKPDFIARVRDAFPGRLLVDDEEAAGIIFSVLNTRISAGEINDIRGSLRKGLRDIWPTPRC